MNVGIWYKKTAIILLFSLILKTQYDFWLN